MRTMLEISSVLLCHCLCLGKVHGAPAFARKRRVPGNLCRFNSPQPTSFECKFNLRGDGPESPATYIDSKSAAPERDGAGSVTSDHSPVCVAQQRSRNTQAFLHGRELSGYQAPIRAIVVRPLPRISFRSGPTQLSERESDGRLHPLLSPDVEEQSIRAFSPHKLDNRDEGTASLLSLCSETKLIRRTTPLDWIV